MSMDCQHDVDLDTVHLEWTEPEPASLPTRILVGECKICSKTVRA